MLPTSRNSSTPPALSVIVNSSGASAPLNTSVSVPLRPFDEVAAVARVPDEVVVARPEDGVVVAGTAIDDQVDVRRVQRRGVDHVVLAERVQLDRLDLVELHQDVADVAEQLDAVIIVARDGEGLDRVGAVELERVGAAARRGRCRCRRPGSR